LLDEWPQRQKTASMVPHINSLAYWFVMETIDN
jgi:hypothetical protein